MKEVTIKEFQNHASKYVTQLPILLTKYGMPVAKVVAVSYEIKDVDTLLRNNEIGAQKILEKKSEVYVGDVTPEVTAPPNVRCEAPLCKNPAVGVGKMFDETSGEMREIQLCSPHLKRSLKEGA